MGRTLYCAYWVVGLVVTAGMARADGRWLQPTNGWSLNYVASVYTGPGTGLPKQINADWDYTDYQTDNPAAENYIAITNDGAEGPVLAIQNNGTDQRKWPDIRLAVPQGAGTANDRITLDFRFRLTDASKADTVPQLSLAVNRPRPDGVEGRVFWFAGFAKAGIQILKSTYMYTVPDSALGTNWHNVRILIDVANTNALLYFDHSTQPIAWGGSSDTVVYNYLSFGDGSSGLEGAANVKYLRWTTNEWVEPLTLVHDGNADPATEGWTYTPKDFVYAASNGALPSVASPAWEGGGFPPGGVSLTNDEITGEATLHLVMTNTTYAYGSYQQKNPAYSYTTNDLVTCAFRFRLLEDTQTEDQGQLLLHVSSPRSDGVFGRQLFYLHFAKDRIGYYDDATFSTFPTPLGTNWHEVSWTLNLNTRDAAVYLDGNPTASFLHKSFLMADVAYNSTSFGDGSGGIQGIARVSYLRLTRRTLSWQGGVEADATPYWQGIDGAGSFGFHEAAVPAAVMTNAQGWTASCRLSVPQASSEAFGVMMRCCDSADRWSLAFTPGAYYYQNAAGSLVQLGTCSLPGQYQMFQMYFDPAGNSGSGTVSYYKNGWLIQTLTRADTYTNGSSTNLFQWGCDSTPSATSAQRWNLVEFAPGNRIVAPIPRAGTMISVR